MVHLLFLVLSWWQPRSLDRISRNNIARREAEAAYRAGRYAEAAKHYTFLTSVTPAPPPELLLNLGHSCFQMTQYELAKVQYERLRQVGSAPQTSIASVQLGIIACQEKDSATALDLFEQALLLNPDNEPARHNFELIKRTWSGRKPTATPKTTAQPTATKKSTRSHGSPFGPERRSVAPVSEPEHD